jgi:hypothetical protein
LFAAGDGCLPQIAVAGNQLFIRLDLSNGKHIGPGKIACSKRFEPKSRFGGFETLWNVLSSRLALGS